MQITEWWPVLLGWPALLIALTLSGLGLFQKRPSFLYTATLLALPVSLYLAGTPRFAFAALLAPLALLLAGLATKRNRINVALGMVLPVILFFGWLAVLALRQPGNHH